LVGVTAVSVVEMERVGVMLEVLVASGATAVSVVEMERVVGTVLF